MTKIDLTDEQKEILHYNLSPGDVLKVIAFAGTGKTTTLIEYAKARPEINFLYIAFNKSVQLEAASKFSPNVTCRTSHSIAFAKGFKHKERLVPSFRANVVMEALELKSYEDARFTIDTLNNYLVSSDDKVSKRHIPVNAGAFYRQNKRGVPNLVGYANRLGRKMCDGSDENIGMLHDGYLKLFQLSRPSLNYDCILLDEAQDINPVTADIVFSQAISVKKEQKPSSIILVGDSHQQIYSFRGAKDTLKKAGAKTTLYLTKSFRFPSNIARAANMILTTFKNENKKVEGISNAKSKKKKWNSKNYTVIARNNSTIFKKAIELCGKNKIGFVGSITGYKFDLIHDVFRLFSKQPVKNAYIRSFGSYYGLKSYAQDVEDLELLSICGIVEDYEGRIPELIKRVSNKAVDVKDAEIIFSTTHKAKGLEWDNVLLMDDFQQLASDEEFMNPSVVDPDEFNLIYVAITRAKINLRFDKNCSVPKFIELYQNKRAA